MGKKTCRKTYVSKGQRRNISQNHMRVIRSDTSEITKALNKAAAWRKGQNPWITVKGPSSNMAFIKVRANQLWGDPKGRKDSKEFQE